MIGLSPVLLPPARGIHGGQADLGLHQVTAVGRRRRHLQTLAGVAAGQAAGIVAIETHGRIFPAAAVQAQAQRDLTRRARLQRGSVGSQQALQRCMAAATQRFQRPSHLPGVLYLPAIPGRVQAPDALAPARFVRLLRAMLLAAEADVQRPLPMQAPRLRSVRDAGPVRPDLSIQRAPVSEVAAGNGIALGLRRQQQRPGPRHLAIVVGLNQNLRPLHGNDGGQALPYLRSQLQLVFGGQRQQGLPVVLQHLRRLVAGEFDHAGQQFAALAIPIAAPGLGTDRHNRFIGQQIQRHVEKGRAG
ncbi:Uncharacterised protein [Stenotrophomonas maltophilia]|nr:Uncharacterised protein [Stenotrophomonas maltophilia]